MVAVEPDIGKLIVLRNLNSSAPTATKKATGGVNVLYPLSDLNKTNLGTSEHG